MIEIRQLRHFLAVVEAGGFRSASRRVHLSPPALTRSIQMLEEHYGVALLDRGQSRVVPTAIGRQLVLLAQRVVNGFDDIPNHIEQLAGFKSGRLRVGMSPVLADICLKSVTAKMIKTYAGIELQVTVGMADGLLAELSKHELDMVMAIERPMELKGNLEISRLYTDSIAWWVRKGHPLAGRACDLGVLGEYPLVFQPLPPTYREWVDDILISIHRDGGDVVSSTGAVQCADYDLLVNTTLETDAIALIPYRNVAFDMRCKTLKPLQLPMTPPELVMSIAHSKLAPPPPGAEKFLTLVREQLNLVDEQMEACGFSDLLSEQNAV